MHPYRTHTCGALRAAGVSRTTAAKVLLVPYRGLAHSVSLGAIVRRALSRAGLDPPNRPSAHDYGDDYG